MPRRTLFRHITTVPSSSAATQCYSSLYLSRSLPLLLVPFGVLAQNLVYPIVVFPVVGLLLSRFALPPIVNIVSTIPRYVHESSPRADDISAARIECGRHSHRRTFRLRQILHLFACSNACVPLHNMLICNILVFVSTRYTTTTIQSSHATIYLDINTDDISASLYDVAGIWWICTALAQHIKGRLGV